jgi:hypothetical protein
MAINIPILTSFNGKGAEAAIKEFQNLTKASDKAAFAINKMAVPAALAFGAIVTGGYKAAQAASDFNETVSKSGIIFGEASTEIKRFADTAASSLGLSKQAALDAAATMGTFGKSAGLAGTDLSNFSIEMVKLSGDLASFHNANPADVALALGAALRGEAEPIRKFGVLLNDAAVKAQAMKMGLYDGTGALSAQAKVLATQKIILEQTSDAQGDFARTSDGAANQQRILAAQVSNAKVAIGQAFLPILEAVLPVLVNFATAIGNNTGEFVAFVAVIGTISGAIVLAKAAMALWKAASIITTAVNYALATSFTAVQISTGIGIIAVVAGVAAFAAYTNKMNAARKESDLLNQQTLITAGTIGSTGSLMGPKGFIGPELTNEQLKEAYANYEKVKNGAGAATKANYDYAKSLKEGLQDALKQANSALDDAKTALLDYADTVAQGLLNAFSFADAKEAGDDTGKGFLSGLRDQVNGIKDYSNDIQKALNLGLTQDALAAVLAAGSDAGAAIAKELVKGGETAIFETNALVDSANMAAQKVGMNAANAWYQTGVDQAQKTVNGLQAEIDKLTPKMMKQMDALANKLARTVDITVRVNEVVTRVIGGVSTPVAAPVTTGPGVGIRSGQTINVNINGGISTSAEIGKAVVNSIRQFNLLNGPANIQVA